jgi:hypothetical protein
MMTMWKEAPRVAEEHAEIQAELVDDTEQEQTRQDYEERIQEEVQAMKQAPVAEIWSPTDKRKKVVFFTLAAVCIVGVAAGINVPFVLKNKPNGVLAKDDATNTSSPNGAEIEGVGWMETYLIFVRSNSRRLFRKKTVAVSNNNQYIVGGRSGIVRIHDRRQRLA